MDENPENASKKAAYSEFYANIDENPERALLPPPPDPDPLRISTKIRKTPSKARRFPDFRPANPTPLPFPLGPEPSLETRRTGREPALSRSHSGIELPRLEPRRERRIHIEREESSQALHSEGGMKVIVA
jgi:hypothetical protein